MKKEENYCSYVARRETDYGQQSTRIYKEGDEYKDIIDYDYGSMTQGARKDLKPGGQEQSTRIYKEGDEYKDIIDYDYGSMTQGARKDLKPGGQEQSTRIYKEGDEYKDIIDYDYGSMTQGARKGLKPEMKGEEEKRAVFTRSTGQKIHPDNSCSYKRVIEMKKEENYCSYVVRRETDYGGRKSRRKKSKSTKSKRGTDYRVYQNTDKKQRRGCDYKVDR